MIDRLLKVQKELKVGKNNTKQGIQFKYRTTDDILERAKPLCIENGLLLTLTDMVIDVCGSPYIESTASVTDGEKTIECKGLAKEPIKLMSMSAPQITGSCSSYARKTALGGLFALDDNEDPDSVRNDEQGEKPATPEQLQEIINLKQNINLTPQQIHWVDTQVNKGLTEKEADKVIGHIKKA